MSYRQQVAILAELLDTDAGYVDGPPLLTDTVAAVTGAPAQGFRRWATDHRAAFQGTS